jgi:hypothetical protein
MGIRMSDFSAGLVVHVDPNLNLDQNTLALYEQMAADFDGSTIVPNAQTTYYSAFMNNQDYPLNGWQGIVENVQSNNGGYLVTLQVVPMLDTGSAIENDYTEQYQVNNDGTYQYIQSFDPQNLAGQSTPLYDF